jgi:nitrogen-specific signal transduction histidine kinase
MTFWEWGIGSWEFSTQAISGVNPVSLHDRMAPAAHREHAEQPSVIVMLGSPSRAARVKMEEQLGEQAGLARLGEMAAVIAHEVKNPLAGMAARCSSVTRWR